MASCEMVEGCTEPITHIGENGYVYCAKHAPERRGWERVRKMRPWELRDVQQGVELLSYKPITLTESRRQALQQALAKFL